MNISRTYLVHISYISHMHCIIVSHRSPIGNVEFRKLVWKYRTKYFDSNTRKLDKAKIAMDLIDHVHALPGRFLKQDGKACSGGGGGKRRQQQVWVEISEKAAKKKVGQAFRDITPHDERFRIGAGLHVEEAEQSSSDDDDDDDEKSRQQEDEDDDPVDGAATAAAAASAAAAGYYPEVGTGIIATSAAASARPAALAHHGRKHSLDDGDYDEHHYDDVGAADLTTTPPLPPLPVPMMMHNPPSSVHGHEPQQGGGGLPAHHHSHQASRLPASEFALYPQGLQGVGGDDSDAKFAGDDNEDDTDEGRHQQSRRNSTESTDALEKLTMEVLVKRARTWEELYYSEREYSKSLEERLLRLLEQGGTVPVGPSMPVPMPKRRKVGDTDALAA